MRKAIRDHIGRILGYEEKKGNIIRLLDITGRELGWYDGVKNETWQSFPRKIIAKEGNLLALLFEKKF